MSAEFYTTTTSVSGKETRLTGGLGGPWDWFGHLWTTEQCLVHATNETWKRCRGDVHETCDEEEARTDLHC